MSFNGWRGNSSNSYSMEMLQAIRKTNELLADVKVVMKAKFDQVFNEMHSFAQTEFACMRFLEGIFDNLIKTDEPMYLIREWRLINGRYIVVRDSRKELEKNFEDAAELMAKALKKLKPIMDESNYKNLPVDSEKMVLDNFKKYEVELLEWKGQCEHITFFWRQNKVELETLLRDCNERANQFLELRQNSQHEE